MGPGGVRGAEVDPSELGALRLLRAPPFSAQPWSLAGHVPASTPTPAQLVVLEEIQEKNGSHFAPKVWLQTVTPESPLPPLAPLGKLVWSFFVHFGFPVAIAISVPLVTVCACG